MRHAVAQLGNCAPSLFLAHVIQPLDALFQSRRYLFLQSGHGIAVFGGVQSAGQLEHRVQVRLGAHAELLGYFAEGSQIAAHQIHDSRRKRGAAAALQAEGDFDVPAVQPLLQHAADLHLHGIELAGHAADADRESGG